MANTEKEPVLHKAQTNDVKALGATTVASQGLKTVVLLRLRWIAIVAQSLLLIIAVFAFGDQISVFPASVLVLVSAIVNCAIKFRAFPQSRLAGSTICLILAFDILQFSSLIYLTGGLENPFAFLLLAPVAVGITSLKRFQSVGLIGLAILSISILAWPNLPMTNPHEILSDPAARHVGSIWLSLVICLVFIGLYHLKVTTDAHNLSTALTATELVLAREQHLSALDGMAAAAAHELGTPLSTISVVVKELQKELQTDSPHHSDVKLLGEQVDRCRDILSKLSSLSSEQSEPMTVVRLTDMLEELAGPYRNFGINVMMEHDGTISSETDIPHIYRMPGVFYGLGNLLENAVDFAQSTVTLKLAWDDDTINLKICDDGPGFADAIIDRLGEPYVTSRQMKRGADTLLESGGLGLGIFIAKTLLERSGATLIFNNNDKVRTTGANVMIAWPRDRISVSKYRNF